MSFKLNDNDTAIVLLALRNLQLSIAEGQSLKGYTDIHPEPETISHGQIDDLCESFNCETGDEDDTILLNDKAPYLFRYSKYDEQETFVDNLDFQALAANPEDALTKLLTHAVSTTETVYEISFKDDSLPAITKLDDTNYRLNPIGLYFSTTIHFGRSNLSIQWHDESMVFEIFNGSHQLERITLNFEELFTNQF